LASEKETAMTALDYASVYEAEYRPGRRARRVIARLVWVGLFLIRPDLAISILDERRSTSG
jgi:hypothetical protein